MALARICRASDHTRLALALFFFFSSRRRHTRLLGDWSSDVCSSDLVATVDAYDPCADTWTPVASMPTPRRFLDAVRGRGGIIYALGGTVGSVGFPGTQELTTRSEERRVGKECRSRWSPYH